MQPQVVIYQTQGEYDFYNTLLPLLFTQGSIVQGLLVILAVFVALIYAADQFLTRQYQRKYPKVIIWSIIMLSIVSGYLFCHFLG